jgi:hypothetical protein
MEGSRNRSRRKLVRRHDPGRLEADLWVLAYEQILASRPRIGNRSQTVQLPDLGIPGTNLLSFAMQGRSVESHG